MCKEEKKESVTREYKDSVFVDLFTSYESPISLYNAVSFSNVPANTKVQSLQISNALYTSLRCDLAFTIKNELIVIVEHQSTVNQNMPTRLLLYIAMLYLNILDEDARYARILKPIPTPRFFVLYNGDETLPEISELRLSDAFMLKDEKIPIQLELIVTVININYGQNREIMEKCETLKGYSYLIDRIKKYKTIDEEHKFDLAIKDCIEHGILARYLITQQKRVKNMLQTEYSFEKELAVRGAEEREAGMLLGMQKGMQKGSYDAKINTVRKCLTLNMPIETIQAITELEIEEIMKIQALF